MEEKNINFSELTYLFADKYVSEGGILQSKEELPNGNKVSISKLGNLLAEVSFAYLYKNNYIDLKQEKRKTLGFIPTQKVIATKKSIHPEALTSLEMRIFDLSNERDVHTILYDLIGEECTLPWAVLTQIVKKSLVQKKYLIEEKIVKKLLVEFVSYKYHLNQDGKLPDQNVVEGMNSYLKEFSGNDFYKLLVKEISSGINARIERSDSDD